MAVLEAAACGVPSVASNIYGMVDAVVDGVTGLLHRPRDVADLTAKMTRIMNDSGLRMAMGERARQRVVGLFPSERINNAMLQLYLELHRSRK